MKHLIIIQLLFLLGLNLKASPDSVKAEKPSFHSMLITDNYLLALNKTGKLSIWDLGSLEKIAIYTDTSIQYTSLAKDRYDEIFIGTNRGRIFRIDTSDFSTELFLELKKRVEVTKMFFNSANRLYLIVPTAIYDPLTGKYWNKFKHEPSGINRKRRFLYFFWRKTNTYFAWPSYTFIDRQDRIWMTASFGEFGGSVQVFDTRKTKELKADFDNINFGLLFPKSVFDDDKGNVYLTSGLQHFMKTGQIYRISNSTATTIYDSQDFKDTTSSNFMYSGIFVGPGAFNEQEQKIYFATTNGFYRSEIPERGRIKNPELLFTPDLDWENEPLAIGIAMTIKKVGFTSDNRLVFLTSNNGIGIYNGEKLTMLK